MDMLETQVIVQKKTPIILRFRICIWVCSLFLTNLKKKAATEIWINLYPAYPYYGKNIKVKFIGLTKQKSITVSTIFTFRVFMIEG